MGKVKELGTDLGNGHWGKKAMGSHRAGQRARSGPCGIQRSPDYTWSFCYVLTLEPQPRDQPFWASMMILLGPLWRPCCTLKLKCAGSSGGLRGGRRPLQSLPGCVVAELKRGSPGDGGPAGTGLAPAGMCCFHPQR